MEFKPPIRVIRNNAKKSIFLAGSIEMGTARNWQQEMSNFFSTLGYDVYNPRRDNWDSSWEQSIDNPKFKEQVTWELNGLDLADYILLYLDPDTKAPISLLELGLHADSDKIFVVCPHDFYRKGNVDIICERFGIRVFETLDEFKKHFYINYYYEN
jgi:hypothetical protein